MSTGLEREEEKDREWRIIEERKLRERGSEEEEREARRMGEGGKGGMDMKEKGKDKET